MKRSNSVARKMIAGSALALAVALTAAPVMAADMDYPVRGTIDHTPVEYGSGWYLRGDIGYNFKADTNLSYYSDARYDYDHQSFEHGMSWGGGFGYVFNNMLRADITAEFSGNHSWEGKSVGTICGGATPGECYSEDEATMDRTTVLANAYVNLGHYGGFTPYVGGGLGLSHIQWSDYTSQARCKVRAGETCDYGAHPGGGGAVIFDGPRTSYDSESAVALTYALTAGFDYRINQNWLFDMGYKWTQVNGGVVISEDANGPGNPQGDSQFDNINLHEIKFGLRYEVW